MENKTLKLKSPAFENEESIPVKYSCDGEALNPPLEIENVPEKAETLALIMDDPDVPNGGVFDHWVVFNIPTNTKEIKEGEEPQGAKGENSTERLGYYPPCPPDREHRYIFKLYALDSELSLEEGASKREVEKAMEGHIIQKTELLGMYDR